MSSTKYKILLVEDDQNLSFIIKDNLIREGFDTVVCDTGENALEVFKSSDFNLCILDIMLPIKDGYTIAKEIRNINEFVPIIFLSAKNQKDDKLNGFNVGADDYMTKPFSIEELIMRIKVFLKRSATTSAYQKDKILIGKYTLDLLNYDLYSDSFHKKLTLKEAQLLQLLYNNLNQTVKRERILEEIWGKNDYFIGRSMDVFISRLRKYLSMDANIEINNYHGIGFKLSIHSPNN